MTADPSANMRLAAWRDVFKVLALQALGLLVATIVAGVIWGKGHALGAFIGAAIGLMANVYSAVALLGKPLAQRQAVGVLINWVIRTGLVISLLVIAMRAKIAPPPALILGIAAVSVAHWIAVSFWVSGRR